MTRPLLALLVTALLTGCAADSGDGDQPRLRPGGGGEFSPVILGIPRVSQGQSWVLRGFTLCVDGTAPVEVIEVRGVDSDLDVQDYAFQRVPDEGITETDSRGTLREAGFDPARKSVRHECDDRLGDEVAIQVVNPHSGVGIAKGFELVYESGGDEQVMRVPYELRLCPLRSAAAPACDPK